MNNPKLPAGIQDCNIEIYYYDGEPKVVFEGKTMCFLELPKEIREPFEVEHIKDEEGQKMLKSIGIQDPTEQLLKRVSCLYGGFDKEADRAGDREFWNCGEWKTCRLFGKFCKVPGKLSSRELEIACLVYIGKYDKEICEELEIELTTVRTYLNRIHLKTNCNNRVEVARWVQKNILL